MMGKHAKRLSQLLQKGTATGDMEKAAEQAFERLPAQTTPDMPPEVQSLIEVKGSWAKFQEQYEELNKQGSWPEVGAYLKDNPVISQPEQAAEVTRQDLERQVTARAGAPGL